MRFGDRVVEAGSKDPAVGVPVGSGGRTASRPVGRRHVVPLPRVLARLERRPFVGRVEELRQVWQRSEGVPENGGIVVLSGESGVGKSRLVARVAARAHAEGQVVLFGRADEEAVSPYQPFVEALRHYAAHRPGLVEETGLAAGVAQELRRLVPELGSSVASEVVGNRQPRERARHELFDAFARMLLHPARSQRLMIVLEDLHWADAPTLLLLREVVRRAAGSRVLFIVTYRDLDGDASGGLARLLADLRREDGLETIPLRGLGLSETAALVDIHCGRRRVDRALARRLFEQTGGNPFFIEELLHSSVPDAGAGLPEGVKEVIGRRLDRLNRATLETLTLASVLGTDFRLATLRAVAPDRKEDQLLAALEAAVAARLVVEDPDEVDRFSFAHALVRETLYERPIRSQRLRLHRRVAVALELAPLPVHPAELAHHYFQAREVGGAAKAVVYCLRAGEARQEAHAYEDAIAHYERALVALELVRRDDAAARCDVLLALGAVRWQASEPDPRSTFMQAVDLARELSSSERLARAALGAGGRFYAPVTTDVAYVGLLEEALTVLHPGDSELRVRVLARLAENLVFAQPPQRGDEPAAEAVAMARRLGDASALMAALMGRHAALLHAGHAHDRRRIGEEVLALAGEMEARELSALARHWLLYDLAELGDFEDAARRHAELELIAAELQQPLYRHSSLAWQGVLAGLSGRFDQAEHIARESVRLAEGGGDPDARAHFTAQLVAIRREQGRLHELLPEIERLADDTPPAAAWTALLPLAYLDRGHRGQAELAYQRALGHVATKPKTMLWLTAMASLAEAAAGLSDPDGAAMLHTELEPYADLFAQWTFTGNAGSVHRLLGRTAAAAGWDDRAHAHFAAALARHDAIGAAPLLARTRCDYGEFLLRGTPADRRRARDLLDAAAAAARHLGMADIAARAGSTANSGRG